MTILARLALLVLLCHTIRAQVPTPREHLGFTPGDDHKLADFTQISTYFEKLDALSDRLRLVHFGTSANGRPILLAIISSEANLKDLGRYKNINRRLALGQATTEEASEFARTGKVFVWIDSGLHATEAAHAQHSPELAYRMLTDESEEFRRFRDKVILLQIPVINPDGLDIVVDWYRKNAGTAYALARLPVLYQKYAGHDNNRDWYMMNLPETRAVAKLLFEEWFPQILYNQHQAPPFPARIFVPPYSEPLNPNIPAAVMEGIHEIGAAMKERFARENKPGVLSYHGFSAWWNGGLRSTPAFHNMHGILTETALYAYGAPREYEAKELPERFGNGVPTRQPSVFYQRPWLGGKWGTRAAIEYMLTADFAILDLASSRSQHFLQKAWEMARENIRIGEQQSPYAYIIPPNQWDPSATHEFLDRLTRAGILVEQAANAFEADGRSYPAGSHVLRAAQPFRGYLLDLLEPQVYPEMQSGGKIDKPYDIAGWTLSMQMGVRTDKIRDRFQANLTPVASFVTAPTWDHRQNTAFRSLIAAWKAGQRVRRSATGEFLLEGQASAADFAAAPQELKKPRVALYEPWTANIDTGWTQWLLDYYEVPYTLIHNQDFRRPLDSRFDVVVLASQSPASVLNGTAYGQLLLSGPKPGLPPEPNSYQRPEYTGGIGVEGLAELDRFVRAGGWLLALDDAVGLPIQYFGLPIRDSVTNTSSDGTRSTFECPGSLIRINIDTAHPLAAGMPADAIAFSSGGHAFDIELGDPFNKDEHKVESIATYAKKNLLASGWLSGEKAVHGRSILVEARHGKGKIVLYGFRPQFRGQPFGTFKLLLNAIYHSAANPTSNAPANNPPSARTAERIGR